MNIALSNPELPDIGLAPVTPEPGPAWACFEQVHYVAGPSFDMVIPHLDLRQGARTAIVGGNGSGKTTLLRLLLGDIHAQAGTVRLAADAEGLFGTHGRRNLGVQMQDCGFNPVYRVRDIMAVNAAARGMIDTTILDALGIDEIATRRFGDLSSGQKQRVQLALALAHRPQFAILDEPTSNLDPVYEAAFVRIMEDLSREAPEFTALYISHTAQVVEACDQVLVLANGRVETHAPLGQVLSKEYGTHAALFEGREDTLAAIAASLPAVYLRRMRQGALRVFGDASLTSDALTIAREHELTRFSTWTSGAADILEDMKHD